MVGRGYVRNIWCLAGYHLKPIEIMQPKKVSHWTILLLGVILGIIGLVAIYDASVVDAFKNHNDKFHFVKQQGMWMFLGIIVSQVASFFPVSLIKKYSHVIFLACVFLLIIVLIPGIGSKFLGARRWILLGPVVVQPSELIKVALVIYLAKWLDITRPLKQFVFILASILLLVMLQPDLGTSLIIVGVGLSVYLISGAPLKELAIFISLMVFGICMLIISSPYRLDRLKTFIDPSTDPQGASYHITQVLYGIGSGGLTGVGLGKSRQKFAFLPEATTDSIFVIVAEELGFIGGILLISTLVMLSLSGLRVAYQASDRFDKLLAAGISLMFLVQTFVNIGSMTAIVPLTGVPLPFISYGGSSLLTNYIALGLLVGVAKRS